MPLLNKITVQKISIIIDKPWFFPAIICIIINSIGIASTLLVNETILNTDLAISESRQRAIVTIMASSLMTLIGVTFSISMLILSNVSTQFGPRLLPNFINSKISQYTLGFFLGTFIFCLFCIYYPTGEFVRGLQTVYAFFLTLSCLVILVIFINEVIKSIRVDGMLAMVATKTKEVITSHYSESKENKQKTAFSSKKMIINVLYSEQHGYVQGIDYDKIASIAVKFNLQLFVNIKPGDFVYKKSQLINIYSDNNDDYEKYFKRLNDAVSILDGRFLNQDIEYGFEQISEIAVRALSPGINDPYTARECVLLLGELLRFLDKYEDIELNAIVEDDHILVGYTPVTYADVIDAAISRLRQAATKDVAVILCIYDMIIKVMPLLKRKKIVLLLLEQAKQLNDFIEDIKLSEHDREAIKEREKHLERLKIIS